MTGVAYASAHEQLVKILTQPVFRTKSQGEPWWRPILRWIGRHLHIHFGTSTWYSIGYLIAGSVGLAILLAVIWWVRHRQPRVRQTHRLEPFSPTKSAWARAQESFGCGDYAAMLHHLLEGCLTMARSEGWVDEVRREVTSRQYRHLLSATATKSFLSVFERLVAASEETAFAGKPLQKDYAGELLTSVLELQGGSQR